MGHREVLWTPGTGGTGDFDITTVQNWRMQLSSPTGTFLVAESVSQAVTGAAGIVYAWDAVSGTLFLVEMSGVFNATNLITGLLSGATGTPLEVHYAFPNGIRLSAIDWQSSAQNDILVVRHNNKVGQKLMARKDTSGGGIHQAVGGRSLRVKPYVALQDCTFSSPTATVIRFEYD